MKILRRNKPPNDGGFTTSKNGHRKFVPNQATNTRRTTVDIETIGRRATFVAYAFMLAAIGSIFALSWEGLTNFGREVLGLSGWMVHIVPGSLDGAVIMFGCMAIVSMIAGENATGLRTLVHICAVGSAVFNGYQGWQSATENDRWFAGTYYAALSLLVAMISHWFFRRIKRAAHIEAGTLNVTTVHFSVTEWMKFPVRRWKARTLALEYGITEPSLARTLEAAKNGRIDSRVMLALEAYAEDDSTRVYEYFPPDDEPERRKRSRKRYRKAPELPRNNGASVRDSSGESRNPEVRPELSPGTPERVAGTNDVGSAENVSDERSGTVATDAPEPAPEAPETAAHSVDDMVTSRCVGTDSDCQCGHRNAVSSAGSHTEAVHYARSVTGISVGTHIKTWLRNHGRMVATSTVYESLKSYEGPAGIVPFRQAQ